MTEIEAKEYLLNRYLVVGSPLNPPREECEKHNKVIDMAIEAFNKVESMKWIPCNERLPESIDAVNITWVNRNPPTYYEHIKDKEFNGTAHYFHGKWYWYSSTTLDYLEEYGESEWDKMDEDIEVIAWMPLPEPYKKEVEE